MCLPYLKNVTISHVKVFSVDTRRSNTVQWWQCSREPRTCTSHAGVLAAVVAAVAVVAVQPRAAHVYVTRGSTCGRRRRCSSGGSAAASRARQWWQCSREPRTCTSHAGVLAAVVAAVAVVAVQPRAAHVYVTRGSTCGRRRRCSSGGSAAASRARQWWQCSREPRTCTSHAGVLAAVVAAVAVVAVQPRAAHVYVTRGSTCGRRRRCSSGGSAAASRARQWWQCSREPRTCTSHAGVLAAVVAAVAVVAVQPRAAHAYITRGSTCGRRRRCSSGGSAAASRARVHHTREYLRPSSPL
ncbi:hypothetical protein ACJJTC_017173 [Scirpophaga incertulas]